MEENKKELKAPKSSVMWLPSSMKEFHLTDRLNILELDEVSKKDKQEMVWIHLKRTAGRKIQVLKTPVVIQSACKTKDEPTKKDFIIIFNYLNPLDMFQKNGDIKLGPQGQQSINEDGKFSFYDRGANVLCYISRE